MFKIDFSSKKVQLALRFFTYGVMALATLVLSSLAVLYALGYRFNKDFSFEQGGVAQFRSLPSGAMVFADNVRHDNTPSRAYLSPGQHNINMQLTNYRYWSRQVSLVPGQLLWLDYVRLIPNTINTSVKHDFSNVFSSLASPDRRWILVQQQQNSPILSLVDVNDEKNPKITDLPIPETVITKKDGSFGNFELIEWAADSKFVLVRHNVADTSEIIRIDRTNPANATNITNLFRLSIGEVHFSGKNSDVLYGKTDDVLRRLDIPAASASAALVTGLKSFVIFGDDEIAFVANREQTVAQSQSQIVGVYGDGKETVVKTFDINTPLMIDLAEYYKHQYLAISSGEGKVEIMQDPTSTTEAGVTPVEMSYNGEVKWLKFSDNGRMLAFGNGNTWLTHDLELSVSYNGSVEGDLNGQPRWLDNFHLYAEINNATYMMEFDGQNGAEIAPATGGHTAGLSPNGRSLFNFNQAKLQSSSLIAE